MNPFTTNTAFTQFPGFAPYNFLSFNGLHNQGVQNQFATPFGGNGFFNNTPYNTLFNTFGGWNPLAMTNWGGNWNTNGFCPVNTPFSGFVQPNAFQGNTFQGQGFFGQNFPSPFGFTPFGQTSGFQNWANTPNWNGFAAPGPFVNAFTNPYTTQAPFGFTPVNPNGNGPFVAPFAGPINGHSNGQAVGQNGYGISTAA